MNQNRRGLDGFLDGIAEESNRKKEYVRVYERPSKVKSVLGFIAALVFLVILIGLFTFNVMYFVLLIVNILVLVYFGVNAFTVNGFSIGKTYIVNADEEEPEEENYDDYDEENYQDEDEEERQ